MTRPDPDAAILQKLAALKVRPWSGEAWRHTFAENPPEKRNVRGARWNPAEVEALYVSLDRATAVAEADYLIEAQPLRPRAKRTLHRLKVSLRNVIDLTDRDLLSSLGVDDEALTSDDYAACQAVGAAAAFLHLDGILVPSARSPGRNVVILFVSVEALPEIRVVESIAI